MNDCSRQNPAYRLTLNSFHSYSLYTKPLGVLSVGHASALGFAFGAKDPQKSLIFPKVMGICGGIVG